MQPMNQPTQIAAAASCECETGCSGCSAKVTKERIWGWMKVWYSLVLTNLVVLAFSIAEWVAILDGKELYTAVRDVGFPLLDRAWKIRWLDESMMELAVRYSHAVGKDSDLTSVFEIYYNDRVFMLHSAFDYLLANMPSYADHGRELVNTLVELAHEREGMEAMVFNGVNGTGWDNRAILYSPAYLDVRMREFADTGSELQEYLRHEYETDLEHQYEHSKSMSLVSFIAVYVCLCLETVAIIHKAVAHEKIKPKTVREFLSALKALGPRFYLISLIYSMGVVLQCLGLYMISNQIVSNLSDLKNIEYVLANEAWHSKYLDAILTGSASQYALNGDITWSDRYMENVDILTESIVLCQSLATSDEDQIIYDQLDAANVALIDLETIALDNYTLGFEALYCSDYIGNKSIYNIEADTFVTIQQRKLASQLSWMIQGPDLMMFVSTTLAATGVVTSLLAFMWRKDLHKDRSGGRYGLGNNYHTTEVVLANGASVDSLYGHGNGCGGVSAIPSCCHVCGTKISVMCTSASAAHGTGNGTAGSLSRTSSLSRTNSAKIADAQSVSTVELSKPGATSIYNPVHYYPSDHSHHAGHSGPALSHQTSLPNPGLVRTPSNSAMRTVSCTYPTSIMSGGGAAGGESYQVPFSTDPTPNSSGTGEQGQNQSQYLDQMYFSQV
eukprot:TRINITY_DN2260_c0_g1::TRINITY_DN2260_c0_g1_i1::g.6762::m.6762 TRINITY_DN2260_c0_g1::TRINITY_DN2260_c0_g1_i1::g.6762  ORF type:complete len:671 (+),score=111.25 TRINITY_DN2260_c0_g1_i1:250-2262(+)